jgi:lantibiotic modifying enzyme
LIRLLQIIDGRDFWADNLKVQGTLPAFIDFECIMHPRLRIPEADADARRKRDEFEDSPLASAVISHRLAVAGGSEEFGGLSPPGERKLPMRGWASSSDRRHGSLRLAAGQIYWTAENAWPVVEGAHAQAAAYTAELEHGYRAIHALLLRSACDFATRGPLAGMGASPVRVLLRSTWEYLDALRASLEPPAMLDGVERELALAPIVRGAPAWPADDDGLSRYRIAIAEAASVRRLDVPEFHSLPSDQSLLLPDGQSVPEFFDETALGRFRRRVEQLPQFDVERHLEVIRTTVEAMGR